MGIVPYGAISRCFTDEAGRLNQAVAAICDRAVFVAAGLPLHLKGAPC
jgi:adenosylcobinamide kinase/adenosylcobinamide-phosphate guanylyltransferase